MPRRSARGRSGCAVIASGIGTGELGELEQVPEWVVHERLTSVDDLLEAVDVVSRVPEPVDQLVDWRHGGMHARPLLYGLIMFKRMLGPDSRLVPVRLHGAPSRLRHLTAWAVRSGRDTLKVLLTNDGARPLRVAVRLPATGPSVVQRLLAHSASATSGVTLDGQQLDGEVRWHGRPTAETVTPAGGSYVVAVPRLSAAMLAMHVSGRTLTSRSG